MLGLEAKNRLSCAPAFDAIGNRLGTGINRQGGVEFSAPAENRRDRAHGIDPVGQIAGVLPDQQSPFGSGQRFVQTIQRQQSARLAGDGAVERLDDARRFDAAYRVLEMA